MPVFQNSPAYLRQTPNTSNLKDWRAKKLRLATSHASHFEVSAGFSQGCCPRKKSIEPSKKIRTRTVSSPKTAPPGFKAAWLPLLAAVLHWCVCLVAVYALIPRIRVRVGLPSRSTRVASSLARSFSTMLQSAADDVDAMSRQEAAPAW